ncbi:atlastin-2-like [Clavelina lepadiformis]|uniref:atlastin-2-like n=1 Tax=Clavelina lepadiformis TaxID=159417 RepID=UPI004041F535
MSHSRFKVCQFPDDAEVVKITKNVSKKGKSILILDADQLKKILLQAEDLPVVVDSIVGPTGSGKSFLLNLLLGHLKKTQLLRSWFSYKNGFEPVTTGIDMLNKPIICDLGGLQGKVAIFLMDTQGLFDLHTSKADGTVIAALTLLMSSCVIFNVKSEINSAHLQWVHDLTKFAKELKESGGRKSPFQDLLFLVRDWSRSETYGFNGGRKYLDYMVPSCNHGRAEEHRLVQEDMKATFDNISCSVLSYPGNNVARMSDTSQCRLIDVDEKFSSQVEELCEKMFSPQGLVLKMIGGQQATGRDLYQYVEGHSKTLDEDFLGKVKSFIEVDIEIVAQKCRKWFISNLTNSVKGSRPDVTEKDINEKFFRLKEETLKKFDGHTKPNSPDLVMIGRNKLARSMDEKLKIEKAKVAHAQQKYSELIERYKEEFKKEISWFGRKRPQMNCLMFKELENKHNGLAMKLLNELSENERDSFGNTFIPDTNKLYEAAKDENWEQWKTIGKYTIIGAVSGGVVCGVVAGSAVAVAVVSKTAAATVATSEALTAAAAAAAAAETAATAVATSVGAAETAAAAVAAAKTATAAVAAAKTATAAAATAATGASVVVAKSACIGAATGAVVGALASPPVRNIPVDAVKAALKVTAEKVEEYERLVKKQLDPIIQQQSS